MYDAVCVRSFAVSCVGSVVVPSSRRFAARARAAHLGGSRDARRTTDASSRRASNSRRRARGFVRRCVRVAFSSVSVANRTESNRNRIEIESKSKSQSIE